jgi:hypothetical protein
MSISTRRDINKSMIILDKRYTLGDNITIVFNKYDLIYREYGFVFPVNGDLYIQDFKNGWLTVYDKSKDSCTNIDIRHIADVYHTGDKTKTVYVIPMYRSIIMKCFKHFKQEFYHEDLSRLIISESGNKTSPKFTVTSYLEDSSAPNKDLVYCPLTKKFLYKSKEHVSANKQSTLELFADVVNTCSKGYSVSSINIYMGSRDCVVFMYDRDNRVFYEVKFLK